MMVPVLVNTDPLDAGKLLSDFTSANCEAGAIVSCVGQVRAEGGDVNRLHLQSYEPLTTAGILDEINAVRARFDLVDLIVRHRIGDIAAGETIVFVAAASAHRRAAFEAADSLMDALKTRAVFWKREDGPDGPKWIEPRAQDYTDAKRWIS